MRRSIGAALLAVAAWAHGPTAAGGDRPRPKRTEWSLHLTVVDELGRPVDADVELRFRTTPAMTARATAAGLFERSARDDPPLSVRVTSPAHTPKTLDTSVLAYEPTRDERVVLRRCRAYVLRVVDEQGVGVAGASAHVAVEAGDVVGAWTDYGVPERPRASSTADGGLTIDGVPPAIASHLVVRACPYATQRLRLLETAPGRVARLPDLVLRSAAGVTGRVVTVAGLPVPGVRVGVGAERDEARRGGSDPDGSFGTYDWAHLSPPVVTGADGRFRVGVAAEGEPAYLLDGDRYLAVRGVAAGLAKGKIVDLGDVVVRDAGGEIEGRIVSDDGTPLNAYVGAGTTSDLAGYANSSSADGRFRLAALRTKAPTVEVHAHALGHWSLDESFAVGRRDVRLVLRRAAVAAVRVRTPDEPDPVLVRVDVFLVGADGSETAVAEMAASAWSGDRPNPVTVPAGRVVLRLRLGERHVRVGPFDCKTGEVVHPGKVTIPAK